jgi:hypothetical protein
MVAGSHKTLYMSSVKSIEEQTKPNLKKTLKGMVEQMFSKHVVIYGDMGKYALKCLLNPKNHNNECDSPKKQCVNI